MKATVEESCRLRNTGETPSAEPPAIPAGPAHFINRELSWLSFHRRLIDEAKDTTHPLLERVKFFAICGSNLDEFFMVRVAGLTRQVQEGIQKIPPDGMLPTEQLSAIRGVVDELTGKHARCWKEELNPALRNEGVFIDRYDELTPAQRADLGDYFESVIMPSLTPMAFDAAHPFPFISNLALNLAVVVRDSRGRERFARMKLPVELFSRFICVPWDIPDSSGREQHCILLEDLVAAHLDRLFPGCEVVASYPFRVTRNAEIEVVIDNGCDLMTAVEEGVANRLVAPPVRLEVAASMPDDIAEMLRKKFCLHSDQVYRNAGPLAMVDFWGLLDIDRPDLKDEPFMPAIPPQLAGGEDILGAIEEQDILLYHPYDSFLPVIHMLEQAARDPDVLAIKITLYRIDRNSPVISALLLARKCGKQVTALVELKAKFDEKNNITFARTLEDAGVHVVYGHERLKVHAKLCLIVRKKGHGIIRYVHIGSGNYNAVTTRIYADLSYITCDPEIGADVTELFNALTGYAEQSQYRRLLVAPDTLKSGILQRIDREIERHKSHGDGYIACKTNGLLDRDIITAFYRASQAGVPVDLNVRGLCGLRPGIPGLSDTIRVISIVGRFLEHARIYSFRNGGDVDILLGSSDLMPRNLKRRVEVLFGVPDARYRDAIGTILQVHLRDTEKSHLLMPDGTYARIENTPGEEGRMNSQTWLTEHRGEWNRKNG